jgi:predicted MFS family arabinose efflux permease
MHSDRQSETRRTERPPGIWRAAVSGLANLTVAVGISRFSYTALVPALIEAGQVTPAQAGYAAAANLLAYMAAACFAAKIGQRYGAAICLRYSLVLTILSLVVLALDFGLAWLFLWRVVAGTTAALLMVLGTALVVAAAPIKDLSRVGGIVFIGPGLGIALSGVFVPMLLNFGIAGTWLGLGGMALIGTLVAWSGWPAESRHNPIAQTKMAPAAAPVARWVLVAHVVSFFLYGVALMPHSVFWVDFVARGLGHGIAVGGMFWAIAGAAALLGPMAYGLLAERIGFAAGLVFTNLVLAFGLALPAIATGYAALALSSIIFGSLVAGLAALMSGRCRELVPPGDLPWLWGIMTAAVSGGQALGGAAQAYLFELTGSYDYIFASGAIVVAIGALLCIPWSPRENSPRMSETDRR